MCNTIQISVIVCTYNRAQSLAKALDCVAASTLPEGVEWEVLVVDNKSTDQTREVADEFCRRQPNRFHYVFEPLQGLSRARNAGIREARGDVLAFMDDDVMLEAGWLQNLTAGLRTGEWAGAGGRILLAKTFTPPRWLPLDGIYNMGGILYAHFDLGDKPCELTSPPHGTNMAFRRSMFEKYGGFRTDLGRCGSNLMSNEDTEFGRRLLAAGEHLRYEPSAVVYHEVPENRLTKKYLLGFWFDYGRAAIREIGERPPVWGIPRYYFSIPKGILGTFLAVLRWLVDWNPQRRFFMKALVWYLTGQIVEIYGQARHR